MTILLVYTRYRRTPTMMSGVTTTKAIRNPTVLAMTLLETDPDGDVGGGGGALDDRASSILGTAVWKYIVKHVIVYIVAA